MATQAGQQGKQQAKPNGGAKPADKAVAIRTPASEMRGLLDQARAKLTEALAKRVDAGSFISAAMIAVRRSPQLLESIQSPEGRLAFLGVCFQAAELGLSLDPVLGHAYPVPFRDRNAGGKWMAQLIVGYRGFILLAHRSGRVESIEADVVYEGDKFRLQRGLHPALDHIPWGALPAGSRAPDKGRKIGAYCIVRMKGGGATFDFMDPDEIDERKNRSSAVRAGASTPWQTDEDEMWMKTAIRHKCKTTPMSAETQRAAIIDEYNEAGIAVEVDLGDGSVSPMAAASQARQGQLADKYKPGGEGSAAEHPGDDAPEGVGVVEGEGDRDPGVEG